MLIYVYGGSGSGKSAYAEQRIVASGEKKRYYVATMEPFGTEGRRRIARHRALREGKNFQTVECPVRLEQFTCVERGAVLIEDLSNLLANEIWSGQGRGWDGCDAVFAETVADACKRLAGQHALVIVVGNDVYREGDVCSPEMERYIGLLAECGRKIAAYADEVVEVVCGIPLIQKGKQVNG